MTTPNKTLFPDQISAEQIKRYQYVCKVLRDYEEGRVGIEAVKALGKDDIRETRNWLNEASIAMLEAELPEFADYDDEP